MTLNPFNRIRTAVQYPGTTRQKLDQFIHQEKTASKQILEKGRQDTKRFALPLILATSIEMADTAALEAKRNLLHAPTLQTVTYTNPGPYTAGKLLTGDFFAKSNKTSTDVSPYADKMADVWIRDNFDTPLVPISRDPKARKVPHGKAVESVIVANSNGPVTIHRVGVPINLKTSTFPIPSYLSATRTLQKLMTNRDIANFSTGVNVPIKHSGGFMAKLILNKPNSLHLAPESPDWMQGIIQADKALPLAGVKIQSAGNISDSVNLSALAVGSTVIGSNPVPNDKSYSGNSPNVKIWADGNYEVQKGKLEALTHYQKGEKTSGFRGTSFASPMATAWVRNTAYDQPAVYTKWVDSLTRAQRKNLGRLIEQNRYSLSAFSGISQAEVDNRMLYAITGEGMP